jgi:hypothetical protein
MSTPLTLAAVWPLVAGSFACRAILALPLTAPRADTTIPDTLPQMARVNPPSAMPQTLQTSRDTCVAWTPMGVRPGDAVGTWESYACANLIKGGATLAEIAVAVVFGVSAGATVTLVTLLVLFMIRPLWNAIRGSGKS